METWHLQGQRRGKPYSTWARFCKRSLYPNIQTLNSKPKNTQSWCRAPKWSQFVRWCRNRCGKWSQNTSWLPKTSLSRRPSRSIYCDHYMELGIHFPEGVCACARLCACGDGNVLGHARVACGCVSLCVCMFVCAFVCPKISLLLQKSPKRVKFLMFFCEILWRHEIFRHQLPVKEPYKNILLSPKRPEMRHACHSTPASNTHTCLQHIHTCPHIGVLHCNTKYDTSMPSQLNAAENCNTLAHDVRARVHKRTHSHTLYQTHTYIFLVFRKS